MCTPLLTHGEQVDVLDRLDFVLTNISELRKEVEELRNSLQHLAADIVGEVRLASALLILSSFVCCCTFMFYSTGKHCDQLDVC